MVSHTCVVEVLLPPLKIQTEFQGPSFLHCIEQTVLRTQFPHQWVAGVLLQGAK